MPAHWRRSWRRAAGLSSFMAKNPRRMLSLWWDVFGPADLMFRPDRTIRRSGSVLWSRRPTSIPPSVCSRFPQRCRIPSIAFPSRSRVGSALLYLLPLRMISPISCSPPAAPVRQRALWSPMPIWKISSPGSPRVLPLPGYILTRCLIRRCLPSIFQSPIYIIHYTPDALWNFLRRGVPFPPVAAGHSWQL